MMDHLNQCLKSGYRLVKISNGKISEPFVNNGKMFIVKNNEIIKLN